MNSSEIPPIKRSISVSWSPETAFRRFTEEFGSWWPSRTHSIGGERIKQLVFEQREGGRIYEEHTDGRRFQWGQVTLWDPPTRVSFTWHPSRDPSTAQNVEIEFKPKGRAPDSSSLLLDGNVGDDELNAREKVTTLVGDTCSTFGPDVAQPACLRLRL